MRFSMDAAGLGWGFVAFTALDVVLENGDSFTVDLSDGFAGAYGFEVSGAVTYSDSAPEVQTTVYSARGEELVGESLEAMAEGAGVQGSQGARSSAGGPIVIALDAGHDESLHPGADGRGLQEAGAYARDRPLCKGGARDLPRCRSLYGTRQRRLPLSRTPPTRPRSCACALRVPSLREPTPM